MSSIDQREYFAAKYQTIADLPGIGEATATKLSEIGYKTVQSLATASVRELVAAGLGEETADKAIKAARKSIAIEYITAQELVDIRKSLKMVTTGCNTLDRLLGGGLETRSITEFYGEFGSGKSQLCQQLAVSVQLPEEYGGLDAGALFIDTEHTFRPERVTQMALYLGLEPKDVLKKIIFAEAYSSEHQMILLENADGVIKENNIKVIIIDSMTGHFRSEYMGRELLAPRQQKLNQHMHKLIKLARVFNAAAVVTNQVSSTPDAYFSREPVPIGGHIMGHISHTRIYLRKGRNNLRIAKVVASPFLPEGETPLRITARGIEGDELDS